MRTFLVLRDDATRGRTVQLRTARSGVDSARPHSSASTRGCTSRLGVGDGPVKPRFSTVGGMGRPLCAAVHVALGAVASVLVLLPALTAAGAAAARDPATTQAVYNDAHILDTDGNRVEAHAAGMLQHDGRWYWYGESKKTADLGSHGVNCYSSASLAGPWAFEGNVLPQAAVKGRGVSIPGPFVIERPKVVFNHATQLFVMWCHLDNATYQFRHAGVATSRSPSGPFTFVHALQPDGIPSLDMNLWRDEMDPAKTTYFIRSCDNQYAGISRLTDDYLNTTGLISTHPRFEGMAFFRHANGTYYIICSHLTGWNPNPLMLLRAEGKTLDDPQWVTMGNPTHNATSFNTQPTYVVPYVTSSGDSYFIYMADNWVRCPPDGGLVNACYVWLPMRFSSNDVTMQFAASWDLDNPF